MKFTRKEILHKSLQAGLLIATPPLINIFQKYYKKEYETDTTFQKENDKFKKEIEGWKEYYPDIEIELDVLIINDQSIKEYNWVFMAYNRGYDVAPIVVMNKNKEYFPDTMREMKLHALLLKNYAQKHGIYTLVNYDGAVLKRIIDCRSTITEDLYRPVSFIYADMYRRGYVSSKTAT